MKSFMMRLFCGLSIVSLFFPLPLPPCFCFFPLAFLFLFSCPGPIGILCTCFCAVGVRRWSRRHILFLIPRSSVRFRLNPENLNSHEFELHRPSIKGTKLLLKVIKAIIIITHLPFGRWCSQSFGRDNLGLEVNPLEIYQLGPHSNLV